MAQLISGICTEFLLKTLGVETNTHTYLNTIHAYTQTNIEGKHIPFSPIFRESKKKKYYWNQNTLGNIVHFPVFRIKQYCGGTVSLCLDLCMIQIQILENAWVYIYIFVNLFEITGWQLLKISFMKLL